MTLSTRAEHERGREMDRVRDEVSVDICPSGRVETALMTLADAEGVTRESPAVVDRQAVARTAADELRPVVRDAAMPYASDTYIAERVAEELCRDIDETVVDMVEASPFLVAAAESETTVGEIVDSVEVEL